MKRTKGSVDWTKQEPITNTPRKARKKCWCGAATVTLNGHCKFHGLPDHDDTPRKATLEVAVKKALDRVVNSPDGESSRDILMDVVDILLDGLRTTGEKTK